MRLALGDPVVASLQAPADPPPNYGARVEVPVTRAIVSFWVPAVIDLETNIWTVTLESPVEVGDYLLVWRSGSNEEVPEVFVPLMVS